MLPQIQCMQLIVLSLTLLLLQSTQIRAGIPAILVFGDSTVDSGNNNCIPTITKSNFPPYGRDFYDRKPTGRFSNGRLSTDFISEAFGLLPAIPAFLDPQYRIEHNYSAVCFASAGSGFDDETTKIQSAIPLSQQLEYYKQYQGKLMLFQGETKAEETIREALHILSLGTNDFIAHYFAIPGGRSLEYNVSEYEDLLIGIAECFIRDIYNLGARKLGITGLAPFGCLPLERTTNLILKCKEELNVAARDFNAKLQNLVNRINLELDGMMIAFGDVYDLVNDVIQNPSSYGFDVSVLGCCGTGSFEFGLTCNNFTPGTCPNADKYVFWDAVHPTQKMYGIVADHFVKTGLNIFL
ncbi:hypothetical protein LUZ60_008796 [Juncus effusus]|nr:hypothetical protein LUZ60_008796 [Juncus effusus]